MSAGQAPELPCLWREAGQAGAVVLQALSAHLPPGVEVRALVLADAGRVLDREAALWWLEDNGAHRLIQTGHDGMEETIWRAGRETSRRAYVGPLP